MALDNLITLGMNYDREPANLPNFDVNWLDLVEIALLGLIAVLKALHERQNPATGLVGMKVGRSSFFSSSFLSFALVVGVLMLLSFGLHTFHYTPVNVLAVLMLSLAIFSEKIEALFARKN
jgi:hypothetical protein